MTRRLNSEQISTHSKRQRLHPARSNVHTSRLRHSSPPQLSRPHVATESSAQRQWLNGCTSGIDPSNLEERSCVRAAGKYCGCMLKAYAHTSIRQAIGQSDPFAGPFRTQMMTFSKAWCRELLCWKSGGLSVNSIRFNGDVKIPAQSATSTHLYTCPSSTFKHTIPARIYRWILGPCTTVEEVNIPSPALESVYIQRRLEIESNMSGFHCI